MKIEHKYLEIENLEQVVVDIAEYQREGNYKLITSKELNNLMKGDAEILIVDTMSKDLYDKRHLKGALHIEGTFEENEFMSEERQRELKEVLGDDLTRRAVFYSSRINCRRSHVMAKWAVKMGYKDIFKLVGGTLSWKDMGYEFVKNEG